jgi:hypothetical protein
MAHTGNIATIQLTTERVVNLKNIIRSCKNKKQNDSALRNSKQHLIN